MLRVIFEGGCNEKRAKTEERVIEISILEERKSTNKRQINICLHKMLFQSGRLTIENKAEEKELLWDFLIILVLTGSYSLYINTACTHI